MKNKLFLKWYLNERLSLINKDQLYRIVIKKMFTSL